MSNLTTFYHKFTFITSKTAKFCRSTVLYLVKACLHALFVLGHGVWLNNLCPLVFAVSLFFLFVVSLSKKLDQPLT
jgi:hypothetical protein